MDDISVRVKTVVLPEELAARLLADPMTADDQLAALPHGTPPAPTLSSRAR